MYGLTIAELQLKHVRASETELRRTVTAQREQVSTMYMVDLFSFLIFLVILAC